jgi:hypothetical protein
MMLACDSSRFGIGPLPCPSPSDAIQAPRPSFRRSSMPAVPSASTSFRVAKANGLSAPDRGRILLRHCGDFVSPLASSIRFENATHQRASSIQLWNINRSSAGLATVLLRSRSLSGGLAALSSYERTQALLNLSKEQSVHCIFGTDRSLSMQTTDDRE